MTTETAFPAMETRKMPWMSRKIVSLVVGCLEVVLHQLKAYLKELGIPDVVGVYRYFQ